MPLHPDAAPWVEQARAGFPDLGGSVTDAPRARELVAAAAREPVRAPLARVEDRLVPGADGGKLPARIYWPRDRPGQALVVYFHGGGWVLGGLDGHDATARALASGAGTIVVSVDYRLAPEHRFPAAAEDAYAATAWAAENAVELGGDPERLAVAGDSAGGNLAAVAALLAVERGGPEPAFQLLVYPVTDHDFDTESYADSDVDCLLTRQHMIWFWEQYAPDPAQRDDPRASPLRARDLSGLPPAHVVTAGRDPLRTEGRRYAERLRAAGVPTSTQHCPGLPHGFARFVDDLPLAKRAMAQAHAVVAAALDTEK